MAEVTRRRTGEFLRVIFQMLQDKAEGLPAKTILDSIPGQMKLTEYEKGSYHSTPDAPRYEKIIRFATIDLVKAGWLSKSQGRWFITDEGKSAYRKHKDPDEFYKEAVRLYHEWKRNRTKIAEGEPEEHGEPKVALTVEEAEEKSRDQIQQYLKSLKPYDFQEFIADLLRALDYHISWVAPPGKDRGIDIIAFTDPLGAHNPRIKVQVKHRENSTPVDELRAFLAVLGTDDLGIFVSAGGFTADAKDLARTQERRKVTLLDLDNVIDFWIEHYNKLTQTARQRLPLKPIYFLDLAE